MVELITNTNFSIQFVLDKINANEGGAAAVVGKQSEQKAEEEKVPTVKSDDQESATGQRPSNELDGFEANDITNGRAFMSNIIRLHLHWKKPKRADLPTSIIMKVPGPQHMLLDEHPDTEDVGAMEFLIDAHRREIQFYECFPRLEPALRLPKFYFGSDYHPSHRDGIILMEDLTTRACTVPVLPGFSDAQVLALLREIARVHVTAWLHPEWETGFATISVKARDDFFEEMRRNAEKLIEIDPIAFGTLVPRLRHMFTHEYGELCHYSGMKYGFLASAVHGDLWSANALWELQADGQASARLCAIIDWQTLHAGNCCEDIARILSLNSTGAYRRQNTERLLEFYAQSVAEFMGNAAAKVPFTMDQLKDAYKHSMPFTMMYFCFGTPFYHEMDSVVGKVDDANGGGEQRQCNQRELLQRCRMFLEDTATSFGL